MKVKSKDEIILKLIDTSGKNVFLNFNYDGYIIKLFFISKSLY